MTITNALAIIIAYQNVPSPNKKLRQLLAKAHSIVYIHANDYLEMQKQ